MPAGEMANRSNLSGIARNRLLSSELEQDLLRDRAHDMKTFVVERSQNYLYNLLRAHWIAWSPIRSPQGSEQQRLSFGVMRH